MKNIAKVAAAAVVVIVGLLTTPGYGAQPRAARNAEGAATTKPETYVVVQVGDEFRVIAKSEYKTLPKTTREEDAKAKKQYDEDKKAAAKNKEKFDTPRPLPRKIKKLGPPSFKTQEEAQDWLDKHPQGQEAAAKAGKKAAAP